MDTNNFPFGQFNSFNINIPPPPDAELTNLNWVAGAPVPMQNPVSPTRKGAASRNRHGPKEEAKMNCGGSGPSTKIPKLSDVCPPQESDITRASYCSSKATQSPGMSQQPKKDVSKKDKSGSSKGSKDRAKDGGGETKEKKPNCSYTSLIGLALMASDEGCLPVSEIYTYIEYEFPYFRSAPDGWKNSIRHNLSLNPAFRKVKDSMRWQGKKGFYWEVTPERRSSVEREVERYLRQEGKLRDMDHIDGTAPFPSCLHASIPTMPQTPSIPLYPFQFCTGTQPYYDIASSMQRHYPPPPSSLPPPPLPSPPHGQKHTANSDRLEIPPTTTATITLLDTDMSPGQFAGFCDPATSSANSALHDLFGLQLSSPKALLMGPHYSSHIYTHPPIDTRVVDSCAGLPSQYVSPFLYTGTSHLAVPEISSGVGSDSRTMRLRTQALNQLIIPKENSISTTQTEHATISESLHTPSHFLQSSELLNRCMTLEECFGTEDDYCSGSAVEYCGELPLPPSAHARMGREEKKFGVNVKLERQTWNKIQPPTKQDTEEVISPGSSPMELSSGGPVDSDDCGRSRRGRRRKRRRRRRVSLAGRPTSQGGSVDTKRSNCREISDIEKGNKGDQDTEQDEGEDMLSHVFSDSEDTVRATLLSGVIHATCTVSRVSEDGLSCMVEDGVYSPPPDPLETVFIPSQPLHEVY